MTATLPPLNNPSTLWEWGERFDGATFNRVAEAKAAGKAGMKQVEENAGLNFKAEALVFCRDYIKAHGPVSSEVVTDACKAAGIVPHCDKAFGPIYQTLARDGHIEREGYTMRVKGHGTGGATVWRVKK